MKNVIITGADGFVGSYTVQKFLEEGMNVLAIDISEKPNRLKEHKNLTYLQCDINNTENLKAAVTADKYDTFVHLDHYAVGSFHKSL